MFSVIHRVALLALVPMARLMPQDSSGAHGVPNPAETQPLPLTLLQEDHEGITGSKEQ